MTGFSPLPLVLTLEEAAEAMTERTGRNWTARQILGCAERHEIQVIAPIGHAVTYIREAPDQGRTDLVFAPAGSLPPLSAAAIRGLLLTGTTTATGWDERGTVVFEGESVPVWKPAFRLAPGHKAPAVTLSGCRVSAAGVMQLAEPEPSAEPVPPVDEAPPLEDWKMRVQAEAAAHWLHLRKLHCNPTKNGIRPHLAKWCRENNIRTSGPSGVHPSEGYIKNVLIKWNSPR